MELRAGSKTAVFLLTPICKALKYLLIFTVIILVSVFSEGLFVDYSSFKQEFVGQTIDFK